MKSLKLFFLIIAACFICSGVHAQQTDEVTLVVSADGPTKDEATKTAFRSAIEQAYGTFVSANTTILNDELVKDEIVTISTGNIKEYKEISSEQMPNGNMYVTLQATVSISKLVSYAQSKGAETEFAGATFGINLKMKELNKQNEIATLENLEKQLTNIPHLFDYELELEEPKINGAVCYIYGKVHLLYNTNTDLYNDLLFHTLDAIRLSDNEINEYNEIGLKPYRIEISRPTKFGYNSYFNIFLRSNYLAYSNIVYKGLSDSYLDSQSRNFIISDNLSSPTKLKYSIGDILLKGDGPIWDIKPISYYWTLAKVFKKEYKLEKLNLLGKRLGYYFIEICIPKEDIGKYSIFRVEEAPIQDVMIEK